MSLAAVYRRLHWQCWLLCNYSIPLRLNKEVVKIGSAVADMTAYHDL